MLHFEQTQKHIHDVPKLLTEKIFYYNSNWWNQMMINEVNETKLNYTAIDLIKTLSVL